MILSVVIGCASVSIETSIDTEGSPPLTPELAEHYLARCRQQAFAGFSQFDTDDEDDDQTEQAEV